MYVLFFHLFCALEWLHLGCFSYYLIMMILTVTFVVKENIDQRKYEIKFLFLVWSFCLWMISIFFKNRGFHAVINKSKIMLAPRIRICLRNVMVDSFCKRKKKRFSLENRFNATS